MITHELRFIMGLYPIAGWLIGMEIHSHYPSWYICITAIIFLVWILYESITQYICYVNLELILLFNLIGIIAEIDVAYIVMKNFPITTYAIIGYVYLILYLAIGIMINVISLKRKCHGTKMTKRNE